MRSFYGTPFLAVLLPLLSWPEAIFDDIFVICFPGKADARNDLHEHIRRIFIES
jgi:hypothetical protein